MVLDRVHPAETVHNLKVEHDATPAFKETAQVMARISELAAKFSIGPPVTRLEVVDAEFSEVRAGE